jgi:AcrR family transcriptional regulator
MKPQAKLEARERTAQILAAALKLAAREGYARITREAIAGAAGVSPGLVTHHMGTMEQLRRDLMREALRAECLPVIAQGLVARDRHALKAPRELQQKALAALTAA